MIALPASLSPSLRARLERILKFATTGGIGFAVDVGTLTLLNAGFGVNPYVARVFAIAVAMFTTWMINRRWTWKVHDKTTDARAVAAEGVRYVTVAVGAALVNYGIYAATLYTLSGLVQGFDDLLPPVAAVVGTAVAMFVSWFGYSHFAFRHADPLPPLREG
ncbi:MAG: GtrA family protein [Hyphomicrobiales bacterium]|nr:GtrA family protein [Hyphomicrobiales bacterium]